MTIDVNLLRVSKGGDPEKVRVSEKARFRDGKLVDEVIALDEQWIHNQFELEQARKTVNTVQRAMTERKKASKGQDKCEELLGEKAAAEEKVASLKESAESLKIERDIKLGKIGNIVERDVFVSKNEDDSPVVNTFGSPRAFCQKFQSTGFRPHYELIDMIGGVDFEAGQAICGHRGYILTGVGVLLNQALIAYGLAFLVKKGCTPIQPPCFLNKSVMGDVAELADYDDVLYKVVESDKHEELDKYLIATSEQPITAMHKNKVLKPDQLPIRYVGVSSCFRKEAGSSGRDIRGLFRVHQFEKIEQFAVTEENHEVSREEHERMRGTAEEFYQSLGLAYRVICLVSSELNGAAAKKYDLEAWFPADNEGEGAFRELVSASNCTDFQARRINCRAGFQDKETTPHMLNATLCATERAMCCILENYQTETGVRVPPVLQPFMLGMEFLPFVKDPPASKDPKQKKTAAGNKK